MRTSPKPIRLALVVALLATACGGDDAATKSTSPKQALATLTVDTLPAVNAVVPATLADKLSFTVATVEDDEVAAVVPADWTPSSIPGSYNPPDDADLGFRTRFSVGGNCNGACTAKDWPAAAEKVEFAQFRDARFTITKEEPLGDSGRLVVATLDGSTYIAAAWWRKDARKYYYCRASLDADAAQAASAFEQACRSTHVLAW